MEGDATTSTMAALLQSATEVLTWLITGMGSIVTFVVDNPLILMMFMVFLAGTAVAFFLRLFHSV